MADWLQSRVSSPGSRARSGLPVVSVAVTSVVDISAIQNTCLNAPNRSRETPKSGGVVGSRHTHGSASEIPVQSTSPGSVESTVSGAVSSIELVVGLENILDSPLTSVPVQFYAHTYLIMSSVEDIPNSRGVGQFRRRAHDPIRFETPSATKMHKLS